MTLEQLQASLARDTLKEFITQAWPIVEPSTPLKWNWHHDALCGALEAVHRGEIKRLLVTLPPGTTKSLIGSVMFPTWQWTHNDSLRHLTAGYTIDLPIKNNRTARTIIQSPWYRDNFGVKLAPDQNVKIRFDTTNHGYRVAVGVGGGGTGYHPNGVLIDDPLKAAHWNSQVKLDECQDWYASTISNRLNNDPYIIAFMQRLAREDLVGYLMELGGWETLCLPMHYVSVPANKNDLRPVPDPRDQRDVDGELLWPDVYGEDKIKELETAMGPVKSSGQLEQNPVPMEGAMFKPHHFKFVDVAPVKLHKARGWDTAATEGGGDWTAGIKGGETKDGEVYILDAVIEQLDPDKVHATIISTARRDGKRCKVFEEREGGSAGKAVIKFRSRAMAGYTYEGATLQGKGDGKGNKLQRIDPFYSQCLAGNVHIVKGPWNDRYLEHMFAFPLPGYADDAVDGTSCMYNGLVRTKKRDERWGW